VGIIRRDRYQKGTWNAVSDLDGMKRKASDMVMMWNNAWVGKEEFNPIQPQQTIRARPDNPARNPVRNIEPTNLVLTPFETSEIL
jgi:hypothetical protein